jgi:60 kDa SS-A/Ro ribonucleoprotein
VSVSKIANVFQPDSALKNAPATNYHGAPAFKRTPEEDLVRTLMTGTFEPTFYADARDLANQAKDIFATAVAFPEFLAKAIVYARNNGYMRLAPITALAYLSIYDTWLFQRTFHQVIKTPGDLQDFVALLRISKMRGMGRAIKSACGGYLNGLSEYHAIKYGSNKQDLSLRDIYRLVRPKLTGKASDIAKYIVKGECPSSLKQIALYERFKQETDEEELIWLINEGRLPHELVTQKLPNSPKAWAAVMRQMPIFALLRNLVTLYRHDVFEDQDNAAYVIKMLTDPERIRNSKLFPFRFLAAARKANENALPSKIQHAINDAVELSLQNVPKLPGRVLIANDVSGSMGYRISDKSDLPCSDVAGMLAAAL